MVSAEFKGKDLLKTLEQFPIRIQKNVMTGATRAAANVVRDEARRLVPKDTKNLQKSIRTVKRKSRKGEIRFSVVPVKGRKYKYDGWYAHFIEFGTSKQTPQPFMRPAFQSQTDESLNAAKKYIAERIPKEVEKAKR